MKLRVLIPVMLVGVGCLIPQAGPGGVLDSNAPEFRAVLVHLVVPGVLAVALAILWPRSTWRRSVLALAGCLLLSQIVRMVRFALPFEKELWGRILSDSKGQFLLALSLSIQMGAGLMAFMAARILVRVGHRRAAAAGAPKTARG